MEHLRCLWNRVLSLFAKSELEEAPREEIFVVPDTQPEVIATGIKAVRASQAFAVVHTARRYRLKDGTVSLHITHGHLLDAANSIEEARERAAHHAKIMYPPHKGWFDHYQYIIPLSPIIMVGPLEDAVLLPYD